MAKPNAPVEENGTSSGYAAAYGGTVYMGGGVAHDAIVTPGDGNNHTVVQGETVVLADTTSSGSTITLSDAIANEPGYWVVVADKGGNAGTTAITITAETDSNHDLDGSNQDLTVGSNFGQMRLIADSNGDFWTV